MGEKVSQYTQITTLANGDLVEITQDTGGGSYATKSITFLNYKNAIGGGDMLKATYDPTGKDADVYDYANSLGLTQMPTAQIREYTESGGGSVDFDNYDPTIYNVHFINPASHDRDFTGIVAPSAGVNRIIVIINYGTNKKLKFKHNDSGSTAANRIMLADNSDFDLTKGGSVQFIYNHTENRWYTYSYY